MFQTETCAACGQMIPLGANVEHDDDEQAYHEGPCFEQGGREQKGESSEVRVVFQES